MGESEVRLFDPNNAPVLEGLPPKGRKKIVVLVSVLFAFCFVVLGGVTAYATRVWSLISGELREIQGTVVSMDADPSTERSNNPVISYRLELDSHVYQRRHWVPESLHRRLTEGGPIRLLYPPANPDHSLPFELKDTQIRDAASGAIIAAVFTLIVLAAGLYVLKRDLRYTRLLRDGRLLDGTTLHFASRRVSTLRTTFVSASLSYEFGTPDGRRITTVQKASLSTFDPEQAPFEGSRLAVKYVDDSLYRAL